MSKPVKLQPDYNPDYVIQIIQHAKIGRSPEVFAGINLIPPRIVDEWRLAYSDFDDAYKIAMLIYRDHWERKLVHAASSEDPNSRNVMAMAKEMLNRLNTTDKGEAIYSQTTKRKKKSSDNLDIEKILNDM